jgi:hypothetical protein
MRITSLVPMLAVLVACGGGGATGGHDPAGGNGGRGGTPGSLEPLWGVTVDDVGDLPGIVGALQKLPVRPTARVVFDKELAPGDYADAVTQIHAVGDVMGEIVDSSDVAAIPLAAYAQRAQDYVTKLGDVVDIWEIGNEINGDPWLGPTAEVVPKMVAAYDAAKAAGKATALTLYYNEGCWEQPDHEVFTWATANVPANMKQGLDYVLVSFYEDDCNGIAPDWTDVFVKLGAMFPAARLGFGECGTKTPAKKAAYVDRYYRLKLVHPRYVGGYFWWYFAEDMAPPEKPLWATLAAAISGT